MTLAFWAAPVLSQIPRVEDKWWKDDKVRYQLRLTPQQVQQLEKVMDEFRDQLSTIARAIEAKRNERANLVKTSGSLEDYHALTNQIYALKAELEKVNLTFRIKVGSILTPQQKATLHKIQSTRKKSNR